MKHDSITPKVAKTIRKAYGFTQQEMAEHLGCSMSSYAHFEAGYSDGKLVKNLFVEKVHFSIIARAVDMVTTTSI